MTNIVKSVCNESEGSVKLFVITDLLTAVVTTYRNLATSLLMDLQSYSVFRIVCKKNGL